MVGIYKITNKLNGKVYIGQSIHCGKRLDEHYKGNQLIDEIIQLEGIENFTFEILKETTKEELSYWEDYYIIKYNTMFPNGYNKRWNCDKETRDKVQQRIMNERERNNKINKTKVNSDIMFPCSAENLKELEYNDTIYAWLLLHSRYDPDENYYYIYKSDFTFLKIGEDIHKSDKTVSKRFKKLIKSSKDSSHNLIWYNENLKCYILPCFKDSQNLCKDTAFILLQLSSKFSHIEEIVKTYIWLKKQYTNYQRDISYSDLIQSFGHSRGQKTTYDRYKDILAILQEVGLINFEVNTKRCKNERGFFTKTLHINQVNDKVNQEWLDK